MSFIVASMALSGMIILDRLQYHRVRSRMGLANGKDATMDGLVL
jgi:hypothetical protein